MTEMENGNEKATNIFDGAWEKAKEVADDFTDMVADQFISVKRFCSKHKVISAVAIVGGVGIHCIRKSMKNDSDYLDGEMTDAEFAEFMKEVIDKTTSDEYLDHMENIINATAKMW
jgi:tRNA A37 threonylcarbamoyltransferase TsaD